MVSPQTSHFSPLRPWTRRPDFFSPFRSLAASPSAREMAPANSVWIASYVTGGSPFSPCAVMGRCSALTMPAVTVFCSPSGEPTAITESPTSRSEDLPTWITTGLDTATLMTARSVFGSVPTTFASVRVPSVNTAVIVACGSVLASEITWLLVMA